MKRTGSAGRLVVRGLLGLLLAFVALNGVLLLRPAPIARLVLPPDPPADQNGWPILAQACTQLDRSVKLSGAAMQGYPGRGNGAEPSMQQFLAANEPALRTLQQALSKPTWVRPAAEMVQALHVPFSHTTDSRELARMLVQGAYRDEAAGRGEAAVQQAWDAALLGRRWEGSRTELTGWLTGKAIEDIGDYTLADLTGTPPAALDPQRDEPTVAWPLPKLDRGTRGKFRDILPHFGDTRDVVPGLRGALVANLALDRYFLRNHPGSPQQRYPLLRALPMLFDPAQMEQIRERKCLEVLAKAEQPRWRRPARLIPRSPESFDAEPRVTWEWCYNPLGHAYLPDSSATTEALGESCTNLVARRRLTGVVIALRLYDDEHGRLPASLNALAEPLWPSTLQDPFDGNLIRYLPHAGLVYCVGENLRDDGGDHTHEGHDDVAMRIPFVVAKPTRS